MKYLAASVLAATLSLTLGGCIVRRQPAVYVAPRPAVYVAPRPYYVQPQPVYVQPRPVYVAPPPVVQGTVIVR